jgi:lipopolysaccharide/colanic/teichoic acid biosynthesis glycosyltransferase
MEYLPLYDEVQSRRHEIPPGITGWAQVNGRNALSWEQKFDFDVEYVDRVSFGFDLEILGRTVVQVLRGGGVAAGGHATMPRFKGSGHE